MKKLRYLAAGLLMAAALLGCDKANAPQEMFGTVDITGGSWGNNFQLTDHNGQARNIADFKGKAVVLFFGYTNCPDVCPTTMVKLASVMEKLGKDANRVQVLMVTLDPRRDTPELLKKYVPAFHPSFLGLTGDEQQVENTAKEFKVIRVLQKADENGFYSVDHSGGSYVFDPEGRLRLFVKDADSADIIAQDLKTLLKA
ncbi:SCO family protein [Noviherbaspirillum cavernae]|uniref:SCO family protein n=1 Tax=Noviherbaspirillum cavernae TaxID=2320862 RepID=A0A418X6M3_9BURK|nr:SCO family protein [Noviherbaspirillum cavernae]RJG08134.1 SCO family protein [Noviherbaspirillum cavernae]